jgi:hypothetical protein
VLTKLKKASLVVCLFLFLFVVIGGGLHLSPGGAFLAAATGTPLVVHVFNRRWSERGLSDDPTPSSRSPGSVPNVAEVHGDHPRVSEIESFVRE